MRRKVLLAVLCWLTLSEALGETEKNVKIAIATDNESAESAPRLYRNSVPFGVYASGTPYGSFSFHTPAFISSPKAAGSQIVPVKQEAIAVPNSNGFLKDSYGNKFPHSAAYQSAFPQQFVQLQELPSHLSQPLVSAAPGFKNAPQYFFGSSFRPQALQATPTPLSFFGSQSKPLVYADSVRNFAPSFSIHTQAQGVKQQPTAQQQPTNNKAVFANTQAVEVFNNLHNGPKFQRLETYSPQVQHQIVQVDKAQLQGAPAKLIANNNNKKEVQHLIGSNPPIQLLDLTLLEPLHFDNPIVPQVQHFLPKIDQVTYRKLPDFNINEINKQQNDVLVQNTRKPKNETPKKNENRPPVVDDDDDDLLLKPKPHVVITGNPNGNEFSYEINSPTGKEVYNEQVIKYNKETQSEPVHYNYNHKTESEPVQYSYVRNSKEPEQLKQVHYEDDGQGPEHLIYTFKPEEQNEEIREAPRPRHPSPHVESNSSENSRESSAESGELQEKPTPAQHLRAEHREEEYHHNPNHEDRTAHEAVIHNPSPHHYSQPIKTPPQNLQPQFQPITHEYEEDIRLVPADPSSAPIKVDPNQHIQKHKNSHPSSAPEDHPQDHAPLQEENHPPAHHPRQHIPATAHIHEKSKKIIIQEETPDEMHSLREQMMAEVIKQEENNEEDFEKAYKHAAYGFPGFEKQVDDSEKEIYNPESYGAPRYHEEYSIENTPFEQYQEEGDEYPKSSRLSYKDSRDKIKEDYLQEYTHRKPERLSDRDKKKEDYYKEYLKHRPAKYFVEESDSKKQTAKYTAAPSYDYISEPKQKPKHQFERYKAAPKQTYEYDYSKGSSLRDNSAHASRPHQRYKSKTHFVEPQFQYGFEPVSLPRLLDSELAAMASNDSPESEKPGTRKKLYKENWYIKKTSTSGVKAAS